MPTTGYEAQPVVRANSCSIEHVVSTKGSNGAKPLSHIGQRLAYLAPSSWLLRLGIRCSFYYSDKPHRGELALEEIC
jgi:hypothetical protein